MQQTRAGNRLPSHYGQQPNARHSRDERALHREQPVRHVQGPRGTQAISIGEFHLLPGDTPHRETVLEPGDLITHVTLPPPPAGSKQFYLKLRDRASYEFALASAAVVLTIANGKVTHARIALGGVGTKPWRSLEAESALTGKP